MEPEEDTESLSNNRLKKHNLLQSPIQLPSVTFSRPGSRLGSGPASRSESPIPMMRRKHSVSAGVVDMLEHQLDDMHIDSDYENIDTNVRVEVPIVDDYFDDNGEKDESEEALSSSSSVSIATTGQPNSIKKRNKVTIDDFELLKLIGKGGYGKVYLVQHKRTGRYYAMKVLRKASILLQKRQVTFTMTERSILSEVQHPFIVKLYYAFQSNSKLYLIMEYVAGGELFTHMAKERIFTEDQAVFYTAELVLALVHLHRLGIVFRDAKPENILLDENGHLVLTDFGLSKTALGDEGRTSTFCGTPSYMAPEILEGAPSYDFTVDWWSVGILVYEMLTGEVPFKGKSTKQIAKNITKTKVKYPNYMTPDAKNLITKLLRKRPDQRLGYGANGIAKIKQHRFFRKVDWDQLEQDHASLIPPIVPFLAGEGDASNFAAEFTDEPLPTSIVNGSLVEDDGLAVAPIANVVSPETIAGAAIKEADANNAKQQQQDQDGVDPATAFLGFSFVANSVLDTV